MKKRFTNPDGTVDEVEGTPEEIAAYERARSSPQQRQDEAKSNRRVLTEQRAREFFDRLQEEVRAVQRELEQQRFVPRYVFPQYPWNEPWWVKPIGLVEYPPTITWSLGETVSSDGTGLNLKIES